VCSKERIAKLSLKIRNDKATAEDYAELERNLIFKGVSESRIWEPLKEIGINSWGAYLSAMQNASSFEERLVLKAQIRGRLIGLGLYVQIVIDCSKNPNCNSHSNQMQPQNCNPEYTCAKTLCSCGV